MRGRIAFIFMVAIVAIIAVAGSYYALVYAPSLGTSSSLVRLYFANREATQVLGEKRVQSGTVTGEAIILELIKGPRSSYLWPTLPKETRLLSYLVEGRIAYVNFSRHVQDYFEGGSASELMLVYSVIASLTELPEVAAVQFLVEGQVLESIWGHIDTSSPLPPDEQFIAR